MVPLNRISLLSRPPTPPLSVYTRRSVSYAMSTRRLYPIAAFFTFLALQTCLACLVGQKILTRTERKLEQKCTRVTRFPLVDEAAAEFLLPAPASMMQCACSRKECVTKLQNNFEPRFENRDFT
jgi:hypothetical protein